MKRVIITKVEDDIAKAKQLYWGEREPSDWEYQADSEVLKELADFYDWAYVSDGRVGGSGAKIQSILEILLDRGKLEYLTEYTEEELFEEVADDWNSLAEYMFSWDGDLKITGDQVKKAYKVAQETAEDERLEKIIEALTDRKCDHYVSRGYCQGEVADVYILEPQEPSEDEMSRAEALASGWLWGTYDILRLVGKEYGEVCQAVVLDYTPKKDLGKTWGEKQEQVKKEMLEMLELTDRKIGRAEGEKSYSWRWKYEEPTE